MDQNTPARQPNGKEISSYDRGWWHFRLAGHPLTVSRLLIMLTHDYLGL